MGKQKTMTLYERALEEGREEGQLKNKLETARKLVYKGFSVSEIQDITGLSEEELRENGII